MKVTKFCGSSFSSAEQLQKVLTIIKSDSERKFIIVSAPGKRYPNDIEVTDALIDYYEAYVNLSDIGPSQEWIINRSKNPYLFDSFLAAGENSNAKILTEF